jgi:hypothetical protein
MLALPTASRASIRVGFYWPAEIMQKAWHSEMALQETA